MNGVCIDFLQNLTDVILKILRFFSWTIVREEVKLGLFVLEDTVAVSKQGQQLAFISKVLGKHTLCLTSCTAR